MSLGTDIQRVAEGLIDLHVSLKRARYFASQLADTSNVDGDKLMELYKALDQMKMDIERLMEEVV